MMVPRGTHIKPEVKKSTVALTSPMRSFTFTSLCLAVGFSTAAVVQPKLQIPTIIPGPGLPSLESLNITAEELWNGGKLFGEVGECGSVEASRLCPYNYAQMSVPPQRSMRALTNDTIRHVGAPPTSTLLARTSTTCTHASTT